MSATSAQPSCSVGWAEARDLASLARLEAAASAHPWTQEQLASALGGGYERVLVGRQGPRAAGAVVAFCVLGVAADEVHILNVVVDPAWRRRGLARLLITLALRHGRRQGARQAFLEVRAGNATARALYRSLGFRETGRRRDYYQSPREDAVLMALDLG